MDRLLQLLKGHEGAFIALSAGSVVMFVGTLLGVPWVIARAPTDYFRRDNDRVGGSIARRTLKNVLGAVLVFVGILMLVLPGQGILTLLVGLALLDIPGKHALLVRMARRPGVLSALNYVRQKAKQPPFEAP